MWYKPFPNGWFMIVLPTLQMIFRSYSSSQLSNFSVKIAAICRRIDQHFRGLWDETTTEAALISRLRKNPLGIQQSSLLHRDLFRLEPPTTPKRVSKVLRSQFDIDPNVEFYANQILVGFSENPKFDASSPCSSLKIASSGGYATFSDTSSHQVGLWPILFHVSLSTGSQRIAGEPKTMGLLWGFRGSTPKTIGDKL